MTISCDHTATSKSVRHRACQRPFSPRAVDSSCWPIGAPPAPPGSLFACKAVTSGVFVALLKPQSVKTHVMTYNSKTITGQYTLHSKNTILVSIFRFRLTEIRRYLQPPYSGHVPWVLNRPTQKMRLRPEFGRKRIFCVFRTHGTCPLAANIVLPTAWGANSASSNHLAGSEEPL